MTQKIDNTADAGVRRRSWASSPQPGRTLFRKLMDAFRISFTDFEGRRRPNEKRADGNLYLSRGRQKRTGNFAGVLSTVPPPGAGICCKRVSHGV